MFYRSLLQNYCLVALLVAGIPGSACSASGGLGKRDRSPDQEKDGNQEQPSSSKERKLKGDSDDLAPISRTDPIKDERSFAISIFPLLADPQQSFREREQGLEHYAQTVLLAEFERFLGQHLFVEPPPNEQPDEMNVQNLLALLEWADLSLPDDFLKESIQMMCERLEQILHGDAALTAWKLQEHLATRLSLEHRERLHQLAPRLFLSYARRFWLPTLNDPREGGLVAWLGQFDQLLGEVASRQSPDGDAPAEEPRVLALEIANWVLDICLALSPSHQVFNSQKRLIDGLYALEQHIIDAGNDPFPDEQEGEQDPITKQLLITLRTLDCIKEVYSAAQELAKAYPKICWLYRVKLKGASLEELLEDSLENAQKAETALQAALDPGDVLAGTHYERAQEWMRKFEVCFGVPIKLIRCINDQLQGEDGFEFDQPRLLLLQRSQRFLLSWLPFEVHSQLCNTCYITPESRVDFSGVFDQEFTNFLLRSRLIATISSLINDRTMDFTAEQILSGARTSFEAELMEIATMTAYIEGRSNIIRLMGGLFTVNLQPHELVIKCPALITLGAALSKLLRQCEAEEERGNEEKRDTDTDTESDVDAESDVETDPAFGFSLDAYPSGDVGPDDARADLGYSEASVEEVQEGGEDHCREQALQWIWEYDTARGNFLRALHDHLQLMDIDDPTIDDIYPSFEHLFVRFKRTKRA